MIELLALGWTHLAQDAQLAEIAKQAVGSTVVQYAKEGLKPEEIGLAVTQIDRSARRIRTGDYRGGEGMYPASVVKMFYLAHAEHLRHQKKLNSNPEFERALRDMVVDSNNDATGAVLETLTGTTGGPSLSPAALRRWMDKRQAVNRWFAGMGYQGVNACQKTWNEGPYGRERQGYGPNFELRNRLTPLACNRLLTEIATDAIVAPERCAAMRSLLARRIPADGPGADGQSRAYTGRVLPKGSQLWSKAGWTSEVSHDVAYIKLPDGREFVLAIFTKNHAEAAGLVPFLAHAILSRLDVTGLGDPLKRVDR